MLFGCVLSLLPHHSVVPFILCQITYSSLHLYVSVLPRLHLITPPPGFHGAIFSPPSPHLLRSPIPPPPPPYRQSPEPLALYIDLILSSDGRPGPTANADGRHSEALKVDTAYDLSWKEMGGGGREGGGEGRGEYWGKEGYEKKKILEKGKEGRRVV